MKRLFLVLALALLMTCAFALTIVNDTVLDYGEVVASSDSRIIPWNGDVVKLAKADSTLRFYFMAGEGTITPAANIKIGDSTLIVFPNGETMLVDACQEGYEDILVANLKKMGISHIDYFVLSHAHSDHYAGFIVKGGITDNFSVGKVYYNGTTSGGHTKVLAKCEEKAIPVEVLCEGMEFAIGDVKITVINPTADLVGTSVTEEASVNNASIVMRFDYKDVSFLMTGDLYRAQMEILAGTHPVELDIDVLDIPHHGHTESSISQYWADTVTAEYVIAHAGVPVNTSVYETYANTGSKILMDYCEGYIVVSTEGKAIYVKTSRTRKTTFYEKFEVAK